MLLSTDTKGKRESEKPKEGQRKISLKFLNFAILPLPLYVPVRQYTFDATQDMLLFCQHLTLCHIVWHGFGQQISHHDHV